jgi:hypothetical protein
MGLTIDICVAAGYTFYTVDPGVHVDDEAETGDASALRAAFDDLPVDMKRGYLEMSREFAYGLAKRVYGFQRGPVGRT